MEYIRKYDLQRFANCKNELGVTPLMYAVINEHKNLLEYLLPHSDTTLVSNEGMSPLHFAAIIK